MSQETFAQELLALVSETASKPPHVYYDPDGDCMEFIVSEGSYYGERIDALVTVYRDQETNEVVGSFIKGLKAFMKEVYQYAPGMALEIVDGKIKLKHLFTARIWKDGPEMSEPYPVLTYKALRDIAEKNNAEAEIQGLAFA